MTRRLRKVLWERVKSRVWTQKPTVNKKGDVASDCTVEWSKKRKIYYIGVKTSKWKTSLHQKSKQKHSTHDVLTAPCGNEHRNATKSRRHFSTSLTPKYYPPTCLGSAGGSSVVAAAAHWRTRLAGGAFVWTARLASGACVCRARFESGACVWRARLAGERCF